MRVSKIFLHILLILTLSLIFLSCDSGSPETSETYPETPSEAVTTEELTSPDETTEITETEEVTTEEATTKESATEEVTTEEVTTSEITTEEVVTKEVTTEEVTTAIITEEETTSAPEPHVHVWGSWIPLKSARCVDKGEEKRSCACGESEIRYTEVLGHTEGRFVTVERSTCTSSGYGHRICGRCTAVLGTETLPATGHTANTAIEKATCTENGFERTSCKVCGVELDYKVLTAFGHTEGRRVVVNKLSCTEDGKQHVICAVCTLILRTETLKATGHTVGPWVTSSELSTDAISVRQKHCSSCGLLMDEERIKSLALVEAERVSAAINSVSRKNSFTFAAISDIHVDNVGTGYNQLATKKSAEFALRTLFLMEKMTNIKMLALLGDYTASARGYSVANIKSDLEYVRELFGGIRDYPIAWVRGNHEINYFAESERPLTNDEIFEYVESNSRGLITDPLNPEGGYGYIDFPENRIRMIFLNTSDVYGEYTFVDGKDAPSVGVGSAQLRWLATVALDFSDKNDASEWGIILNSHVPFDCIEDTKYVLLILEAYRNGLSGSLGYTRGGKEYRVEYSFAGYERAEIICSIHGHIHNFKFEKISSSNTVEPWLWRVCVPNLGTLRENQYAAVEGSAGEKWGDFDENGAPIYYTKCHWDDKLGTYVYDEDAGTSYCMVTVNRDERTIYFHYVGIGRDRVIEY